MLIFRMILSNRITLFLKYYNLKLKVKLQENFLVVFIFFSNIYSAHQWRNEIKEMRSSLSLFWAWFNATSSAGKCNKRNKI